MSNNVTLLPEYIGLVQATSINFYNNSTNILTAIDSYTAELQQNIRFNKSKVSADPIKSTGHLFNTLNETKFIVPNYSKEGLPIGVKPMDDIFKLNFIEKYQSFSKEYKEKIDAEISNNVYFTNFSDDIGFLSDKVSVMDCNVNPYYDIYSSQYFNPTNMPATGYTKLSNNELSTSIMFSYYTNPLLKRNLRGLQPTVKVLGVNINPVNNLTAKTAHGTNLVTDIIYYNRVQVYQLSLLTTLLTILGSISSFILFFKLINPKSGNTDNKSVFFKYTITDMEGLQLKVDASKNALNVARQSTLEAITFDQVKVKVDDPKKDVSKNALNAATQLDEHC